jgi:diacylglycerol kinase family enzyme
VLVSNNRYRLGRAVGSGTRPRIDDGLLGITVVGAPSARGEKGRSAQRPWREWSAPTFEVDADRPLPAGVDGEALVLDPPLRFRILPGVLQVRIARAHPGASPSATAPEGLRAGVVELVRVALGREPRPSPVTSTGRRSSWT